jgi:hypothetical protein
MTFFSFLCQKRHFSKYLVLQSELDVQPALNEMRVMYEDFFLSLIRSAALLRFRKKSSSLTVN